MRRLWAGLFLVLLWRAGAPAQMPGFVLYVNNTDATCDGHSPCFSTIQAAVDAASAGDTVSIQAGTYTEQVTIRNKNVPADASENDRIVIEAAPDAPLGSVIIARPTTSCSSGEAMRIQHSKFVTLRGLTITGAGGQAIRVMGGDKQNQAIHLERNRIFGNGVSPCHGGITVGQGNPHTLIVNNLIYGNTRSGIAFLDGSGGPHWVINNTIHGNGWNGIEMARYHQVILVNNIITQNGLASDAINNGFGIRRETATSPLPTDITLWHNLVCGNTSGALHGRLLDSADAGNLTPTGTEGEGITASPGCELPTNVYVSVPGPDGLVNTADDDFALMSTSPAIDKGIDPRTLGLSIAATSLLADFANDTGRPANGDNNGATQFDIGAMELLAPLAGPQYVLVPAVLGVAEAVAVSTLEAAGLTMGTINQTYSATVPAGQVLSQTPVAGTEVAGGTAVHVVISVGTTNITRPSLAITAPGVPVTNAQPGITVTYAAATSALDLTTLRILLDARDVTPFCVVGATAARCEEIFFDEGLHAIEVTLSDVAGNLATASRQVLLDTTPPQVAIDASTASEITTTTASIRITGRLDDSRQGTVGSGPGQVTVNGVVAQVSAGRFVVEAVPLIPGRNTITVVALDSAGNTVTTMTTVVFRDPNALIILDILSPTEGALLVGPEVTIHGTITNATGHETGITVNGIIALVHDGQFVANHVPLQEGENILTVMATDSAGNTTSTFMTLHREATGEALRLTANTYTGLAPLEATLRLEGVAPIIASSLTVTGPEDAEVVLSPSATEYVVRLTAAGLYFVTAEASDEEDNQYTHTIALLVVDRLALDAALRSKWAGMKQAMATRNTQAAVNFFAEETKDLYQEVFTLLSPQLPQLVQEMQDIELIWAEDQTAQYRIRRHELYGGQPLTVTHYIYFRVDGDGLWKILRY